MSYACWYWFLQPKPHDQFILPYNAQSPISNKDRDFNNVDDIWQEISLIVDAHDQKRTLGQELWYLVPLFANPQYLLDESHFNLINEYHEKYYPNVKGLKIHLNASDDRGIDIIRNQINQFVNTKSLFGNGIKFVILDEVDYMTKNAQQALRYLIQQYSNDRTLYLNKTINNL